MKKVALWGSYNKGNYGDDIMALLFAEEIKKFGCEVLVYDFDKRLADKYGVDVAYNYEELLEDASFLVVGGGGMLVGDDFLRRHLVPHARSFEREFSILEKELEKRKIPSLACSIGGDGNPDAKLPSGRKKFFSSSLFSGATVRLPSDTALLDKLDSASSYYPDVLLGLKQVVGFEGGARKKNAKIRVGLNLDKKNGKEVMEAFLKHDSNDYEFFLIESHLERYGLDYEILDVDGFEYSKYKYEDPFELVEFLGSLDLLVSSKLHLGVSALSLGVPFVSCSGKEKTKAFLETVGLSGFAMTKKECIEFSKTLSDCSKFFNFCRDYPMREVSHQSSRSLEHFEFLKQHLSG